MERFTDGVGFALGFIACVLAVVILAMCIFSAYELDRIKSECIELGYGEYVDGEFKLKEQE